MYNFSGLLFRIWGVCGFILLLGIVCIIIEAPWKNGFNPKKCSIGLIIIIFAISLGIVYASRIAFPDISSYTGEFVYEHRTSRAAPPLPITSEYVFESSDGSKQGFYLDLISKKEIFHDDFIENQKYIIYYDKFTNIIVKIEVVE